MGKRRGEEAEYVGHEWEMLWYDGSGQQVSSRDGELSIHENIFERVSL